MKNKKKIYIGLFFIIIVGIASSIHTIQNKPENIIKKFVKAIENKDGNLLCSLYAPDYISYMIGPGSFYSDKDELIEEFTEECEDNYDLLSVSEDVKPNIKYKITNKEKLNSSDLEKLNSCLTEQLDFEKNSVSSAYYVTFTYYVSGSDYVYTVDRYLIKIKGKWYMGRGFTL